MRDKQPPPRNVPASVRARLSECACERREDLQLILTHYAIERLLYRLSVSPHRDRFVLKGAMLFSLWAPMPYRATRDLDLLGYGDPAPDSLAAIFRGVCEMEVEKDGIAFKPETLRVEPVREEEEYNGARVTLVAAIAAARLKVQIDIGFGDAVTPPAREIDYPTLLDMSAPRLRAYPPESVVAEKFQALVALGMLNSRMKDFFDLWAISERLFFDGPMLAKAIAATFDRRRTAIPTTAPLALTPAFADADGKQGQWRGFLRRTGVAGAPQSLAELLMKLDAFLLPPARALAADEPFQQDWEPGGPWR